MARARSVAVSGENTWERGYPTCASIYNWCVITKIFRSLDRALREKNRNFNTSTSII
jgi:hypothetical protein